MTARRCKPLKAETITGYDPYGPRWGTIHYGDDFAADDGTPIYAAQGGTVAYIGNAQGFGQWIVLDHPTEDGSGTTVYGHMWDAFATGLRAGDRVEAGQLIGYVGSNGQSTGPHLHFEVHPTVWAYGSQIPPGPWLENASEPGDPNPPASETPSRPSTSNDLHFGIDIASYQAGLDMSRVAAEGFRYVIAKATEGTDYVNPEYREQKDGAQANGLYFMAYHYVKPWNWDAQADNFAAVEPDRSVRVMLDHEHGSGDINDLRGVRDALRARGYQVVLAYLPRWFWEGHIGSPDLSDLDMPLMSSNYVGGTGPASELYAQAGPRGWESYGGAPVAIYQFTESAAVAGFVLDANVFRGSETDLAALFGVEDELSEAVDLLRDVRLQLCGSAEVGQYPGWPQLGQNDKGENMTLVDAIADLRQRVIDLECGEASA